MFYRLQQPKKPNLEGIRKATICTEGFQVKLAKGDYPKT